jgi:hypothetical protein
MNRLGQPVDQVPAAAGKRSARSRVKKQKEPNRMDADAVQLNSALQGNLQGDRAAVSKGHSSPTLGVMPKTW